jgi:hypothetical protein
MLSQQSKLALDDAYGDPIRTQSLVDNRNPLVAAGAANKLDN